MSISHCWSIKNLLEFIFNQKFEQNESPFSFIAIIGIFVFNFMIVNVEAKPCDWSCDVPPPDWEPWPPIDVEPLPILACEY